MCYILTRHCLPFGGQTLLAWTCMENKLDRSPTTQQKIRLLEMAGLEPASLGAVKFYRKNTHTHTQEDPACPRGVEAGSGTRGNPGDNAPSILTDLRPHPHMLEPWGLLRWWD
jgi:hypothetical protein